MLAAVCAAAALSYFARNAIAVAESTVRADLGLTKEQSGWLMSAFFFSYALCQIPAAQFGQRKGSRFALPLFAAVWSVATAATAFVGGLAGFIVARIAQGIAQAGLFPVCAVTFSKWFPKSERAFAAGSLGSFMSVGGALCAWLTGVLLQVLEPRVAPGWNWRLTFLLFGVPGLVWAVWFWRWFRNEPREHPAVNTAEVELIEGTALDGAPTGGPAQAVSPPKRAAAPTGSPGATPWLGLFSSPRHRDNLFLLREGSRKFPPSLSAYGAPGDPGRSTGT